MANPNIEITAYKKYEKESSKLKTLFGKKLKHKAWTINLDLISLSDYDIIVYETKKRAYTITVKNALIHGIEAYLGGEHKLVIPCECWKTIDKA